MDLNTLIPLRQDESSSATHVTSFMMQLPDEMLMTILSYLDLPTAEERAQGLSRGDIRPELCAVALTCRQMARISNEFMLRDVKLATGHTSSLYSTHSVDRLRKFVRTCDENQHTVDRIRTLQVQADFSTTPDWGTTRDDRVPDEVLQRVGRSSTLEHLSLLLSAARHLQWFPALIPKTRSEQPFARLQSLCLDCGNSVIAPQVFANICGLTSLKHIETTSPVGYKPGSYVNEKISAPFVSNVETIKSYNLLSTSTILQKIFYSTPELRSFTASMAGTGLSFDDHDKHHHRSNDRYAGDTFSPLQQQLMLMPVAKTLQSLSLTNPRVLVCSGPNDTGHDGTFLDLSNFKNLKHVQLSIHHLSETSLRDRRKFADPDAQPCRPTAILQNLLPPSLVSLEIHYDSDQGIFYDPHHLYTVFNIEANSTILNFPRNMSKDLILKTMYKELWTDRISNIDGEHGIRDRLDWLLELAEMKSTRFPKLEEIMVRETYARDWTWKDFDLSGMYPEVFSGGDVKLGVVIRVPREFVPVDNVLEADY